MTSALIIAANLQLHQTNQKDVLTQKPHNAQVIKRQRLDRNCIVSHPWVEFFI